MSAAKPVLAADHTGMRVDYSGLLRQVKQALQQQKGGFLAFSIEELQGHMKELGRRYYAGDTAAVDEFLQLYCVEREARAAAKG